MNNKVQLKEEEVVGNEVVLSDIYPKTDTDSITDSTSGESLDVTLDHMWEAINNKLTRVVNSVNGRTGVVALDASDVGLSNVDNVSFGDIKQWVLSQLEAEFAGHLIKIFASLNDAATVINTNDRSYENCVFFAFEGMHNELLTTVHDRRSYIGYFRYNEQTGKMMMTTQPINVVGITDRSLTYSTNVSDGGSLKVHIHPDEKALYLDNGTDDVNSGLRIDQAYLGGKVYSFFGAYYYAAIRSCKMPIGSTGYPDEAGSEWRSGFLDNAGVTTGDKVHIYINEEDMGEHVLINSNVIGEFHDGDTIVCHFNPYIVESTDTLINDNMFRHKFMFRQPAIGTVSHDGTTMVIKFQSIRPYTTWGITNKGTHKNSSNVYGDTELSVDFAGLKDGVSASPLNVLSNADQYVFEMDDATDTTPNLTMCYIMTPDGPERMYERAVNRDGGIFVQTDYSLCVMPFERYGGSESQKSQSVDNWATLTPHSNMNGTDKHDGFLSKPTFLGVNLSKGITEIDGKNYYVPLSGLKVIGSPDGPGQGGVYPRNMMGDLGLNQEVDADTLPFNFDDLTYTGGLAVNVGKYLDIKSSLIADDGSQYIDQGRVNVRIGDGLKDDNHNRITINCGDGVRINDQGQLEAVAGGASANLNCIKIDDVEGGSIFYNPSADSTAGEPENVMYIHLGAGLYIDTTEPNNE